MIMAAPFPSGASQNVQIFFPLTDLGYKTHSCDLRVEHTRTHEACTYADTHTQTHKTNVHTGIRQGYTDK